LVIFGHSGDGQMQPLLAQLCEISKKDIGAQAAPRNSAIFERAKNVKVRGKNNDTYDGVSFGFLNFFGKNVES
jgi:hypothetical protein